MALDPPLLIVSIIIEKLIWRGEASVRNKGRVSPWMFDFRIRPLDLASEVNVWSWVLVV